METPTTPAPSVATTTGTPPAPVATSTPESKPVLLAGKYADSAALEKGIREANIKLDFDSLPDGELIGEGKRFKDTAAAEKFYRGLDKMIGKPVETPKPSGEVQPLKLGEDPLPDDAAPAQVLDRAKLKAEDLAKQWKDKGSLTDEQYAALKKADPRLERLSAAAAKSIINQEMELSSLRHSQKQAAQAASQNACAEIAGGRDKLDALLKAAPQFVPADELSAMEKFIGDPATAKSATRLLMQMQAEYLGTAGSRPLINGQATPGGSGITTWKEYKDVERRGIAGDKAAQALLLQVDPSKLK